MGAQRGLIRAVMHQAGEGLIAGEQFIDAAAPVVAGVRTFRTARRGVERIGAARADALAFDGGGGVRRAALRAEAAHEALGEHAAQRGGEQERFNAHVNQTGDGAGGIIGVQRGEHEVAGETGLHGNLRGFQVADFANHDDVRVLPQNGAQRAGEG